MKAFFFFVEPLIVNRLQSASESADDLAQYKLVYLLTRTCSLLINRLSLLPGKLASKCLLTYLLTYLRTRHKTSTKTWGSINGRNGESNSTVYSHYVINPTWSCPFERRSNTEHGQKRIGQVLKIACFSCFTVSVFHYLGVTACRLRYVRLIER